MKKTARVIVTFECDRKCPGCCNVAPGFSYKETKFDDLLKYEEIVITGGEPMLISEYCVEFVHRLKYSGYKGKIFLYTAYNKANKKWSDLALLKEVDGVTYTIHADPTKKELQMLANMETAIILSKVKSSRLHIDSRVKELNFHKEVWNEVKYFDWKEECPVIETEDILFFDIKNN